MISNVLMLNNAMNNNNNESLCIFVFCSYHKKFIFTCNPHFEKIPHKDFANHLESRTSMHLYLLLLAKNYILIFPDIPSKKILHHQVPWPLFCLSCGSILACVTQVWLILLGGRMIAPQTRKCANHVKSV